MEYTLRRFIKRPSHNLLPVCDHTDIRCTSLLPPPLPDSQPHYFQILTTSYRPHYSQNDLELFNPNTQTTVQTNNNLIIYSLSTPSRSRPMPWQSSRDPDSPRWLQKSSWLSRSGHSNDCRQKRSRVWRLGMWNPPRARIRVCTYTRELTDSSLWGGERLSDSDGL